MGSLWMPTSVPEIPHLVEALDLSVRFADADKDALHNVSFSIRAGECLAVLGPSGSGKSTLAQALVGAIPLLISAERRGVVSWNRKNLRSGNEAAPFLAAGTGLAAVVLQDTDAQIVALTVEEELAFSLENRGLPASEIDRRLDGCLSEAPLIGLGRRDQTLVLSAGWRQRLALGAALAETPSLLVIDEPTAHLDETAAEAAFEAIAAALRSGASALLIEHRADLACTVADRILALDRNGHMIALGTPRDVLSALACLPDSAGIRLPAYMIAVEALRSNGLFEPARCPADSAELVDALRGPGQEFARKTAAGALAPKRAFTEPGIRQSPLCSLKEITLIRRGDTVLRELDFTICSGEVVGLAGRNGAGKTSLALVAAGALKPTLGSVSRQGNRPPVMVPQNPSLVFASATLALEAERRCLSWPCVADALTRMGIEADPAAHPLRHSHGELRRIALAFAFASDTSRLVILDEPTAGLDSYGMRALRHAILELEDKGCGLLLISHDLDFLGDTAGRIAVLDQGVLVASDRSDRIVYRAAAGELPLGGPPRAELAKRLGWKPCDA